MLRTPVKTINEPDLEGTDHYCVWKWTPAQGWRKVISSTGYSSTAVGDTIVVTPRHMTGCQNFHPDYVPEDAHA